jgi:hypothetical protein
MKTTPVWAIVKTFGLWLITAVLAFFEVLAARDIVFNVYARFVVAFNGTVRTADYAVATWLAQAAVYVMVVVAIAIIIGGFEYHRQHVGQPRSLKVLLWTLGIQLAILLVYLLV